MAESSLRPERNESSRLAWAFTVSVLLHLLILGGYTAGQKLGVWQRVRWPAWLKPPKMLSKALEPQKPPAPRNPDIPLVFVDVSPAQATTEPPKDTPYYSDKNSRAANPDTELDTGVPKITGKQTEVVKTEDIPREKFVPLQPAPTPPPPPPEPTKAKDEQPEAKAMTTHPVGDVALAKPDPVPKKDEGDAPRRRPRTPEEARARHPEEESRLPGEKIKQEGGVKRHLEISSLDARATPFGSYDAALVAAISQRWFSLLDEQKYASDSRGKVVVQFRLHHDGRITEMVLMENTASGVLGLICERAISDNTPFAAWPSDMRRMLGDIRNIQFTFYYN